MPDKIDSMLTQIVHAFNGVTGIDAIVLGGSRATGTANKASDIDIGIYYDEASFDLALFKQKAALLDDEHRKDAITDPGDWGPWINGGGWLKIEGIAVDILFRDTRKVITVINDCIDGLCELRKENEELVKFIRNGVQLGYISIPDVIDSAFSTIDRLCGDDHD